MRSRDSHSERAGALCFVPFPRLRLPPGSTRFPYTTLFRSDDGVERVRAIGARRGLLQRQARDPDPVALVIREHPVEAGDHKRYRSEEHTSELQSLAYLVCRLLLEKKNQKETPEHGRLLLRA